MEKLVIDFAKTGGLAIPGYRQEWKTGEVLDGGPNMNAESWAKTQETGRRASGPAPARSSGQGRNLPAMCKVVKEVHPLDCDRDALLLGLSRSGGARLTTPGSVPLLPTIGRGMNWSRWGRKSSTPRSVYGGIGSNSAYQGKPGKGETDLFAKAGWMIKTSRARNYFPHGGRSPPVLRHHPGPGDGPLRGGRGPGTRHHRERLDSGDQQRPWWKFRR